MSSSAAPSGTSKRARNRLLRGASALFALPLLAGCWLLGASDEEVIVTLGTPTLVPAEVRLAADAAAGSPATAVRIDLPYRNTNPVGYESTLTVNVRGGMPAGLRLERENGDSMPVQDSSLERTAGGEIGLASYALRLVVVSPSGIGALSGGRHAIELEVRFCTFVEDVSAADDVSEVCDTESAVLTVVIGGAGTPSTPAGLAAVPGLRDVRLSWSADPAPDSYLLERAVSGAAFTAVATLTAPVTSHVDTGLDPATRYTYRLTPRNAAGTGPAASIDVQTLAETANGVLAVVLTGDGSGRVASAPAGIDCPGDCSQSYPLGSSVTLSATPAAGSVLDGWSGPADCADGVVTVVAELSCTATFSPAPAGSRGWAPLGELLASGGEAPLVAPPGAGELHVALRRVNATNGFRELVVMRQTGPQSWASLAGGGPNGIASATSHGFVMDSAGRPCVAWTEASAVRVARFDSGTWTRLADNLRIGNGMPSQLQFEWRGSQPPVLSWIETDGGVSRVAVKQLALDLALGDRAWVGGFLPDVPNLVGHRMALDSSGLPGIVVSRLDASLSLPLAAWRITGIADGAVQAEALGGELTIATGFGYQHDQLGYGIGFVLNPDGGSGAPVVLGTRDARWAYAKASNGTFWIQAGRVDNVLDADGLVLDANPANGEAVAGVATMRTPGIGLLLGVVSASSLVPDRIELFGLDGLSWVRAADPLSVPQLSAIGSGTYDSADRPVVLTVENFGAGGRGRIRAYRFSF